MTVSLSDGVEEELSRQLATLNLDSGMFFHDVGSDKTEWKPLSASYTAETLGWWSEEGIYYINVKSLHREVNGLIT